MDVREQATLHDRPSGSRALVTASGGAGPWLHLPRSYGRPDPVFVTHLIATAAHEPQTRTLRRAAPADALTAYRDRRPATTGLRTCQTA